MEPKLDDTEYDVIIYGTGMTETYLSAALACAGKKVLHFEENQYYGGVFGTFSFTQFQSFLEKGFTLPFASSEEEISSPEIPKEFKIVPLLPQPSLINNGNFSIWNPPKPQPETLPASEIQIPEENAEKEDSQSEPTSKPESPKEQTEEEILRHHDRRFNIDTIPKVLWSAGSDVDVLVKSGTFRYLEFLCGKNTFIVDGNRLQLVPCSKKDIFRSKDISLIEKRQLMQFISTISQEFQNSSQSDATPGENKEKSESSESENKEAISFSSAEEEMSFVDFMNSKKLPGKLQQFLLYVISLIESYQGEASETRVSVKEGIARVKAYMTSIGRYGDTPFLIPLYGASELPQAYSRMSAVNGGIFVLNRRLNSIVVENSTFTGVLCSVGQFLKSKHFVVPAKFLPGSTSEEGLSRCVCITDKPLTDGEDLINLIIPPTPARKHTIFAYQFTSAVHSCPAGRYVVHLVAKASGNARTDLQEAVESLFITSDNYENQKDSGKPKATVVGYFNVLNFRGPQELPAGVITLNEVFVPEIGFSSNLKAAQEVFKSICGEEEPFLPERKDPNIMGEEQDY